MKSYLDYYLAQIKLAILGQFQYRVGVMLWLMSLVFEPIVSLVVWQTIARANGGSVSGYTAGDFAAYYIGWTLVRHMNITLTPFAWESRIKDGDLSQELLRPIHVYHKDLGLFIGMKFVQLLLWLPIGALLVLVFQPTFNLQAWQAVAFALALWTAFFMRFAITWALGLITFWTTRTTALFNLYFAVELLLSGRLVPMKLMPSWLQQLAQWLPFKYAFGFQLDLLTGKLTLQETLFGFAAQAFWSLIGLGVVSLLWRSALKRFSAVGA